ncbi:MAG: apolipoprotein N-acyltransferase [Deltaproteobacteria bacterium]|nr:apolipoprotein N-acyltransferase [Deltaproteobacteria bacterium]MBW2722741.1 apolipoprotein N-acyltransferase [Deltaproteobacteria bacterium]
MSRPLSLWIAVLLTALSGWICALAFPPWNLRPLAFVCLVPFFVALRSGPLRRALLLAWFWAVLVAWLLASSFPGSIAEYYERSGWFGFWAGNLIFSVMAAVYYLFFAALDRVLVRRPRIWTPLLVAAAWVTVELARGRLFTGTPFLIGNPWGLIGYSHASGAIAQIASWAGVYGISFVLVAVNAGLAGLLGSWRNSAVSTRQAAWALSLAVMPAIAAAVFGGAVLENAPESTEGGEFVELAVVQGNVATGRRWRSDFYGKNLDVYLELTREAIEAAAPRTVIWPESAMTFFIEAEPRYGHAIAEVLRSGDVELLAGGPSGEGDRSPPYYNSVFQVDSTGTIQGRYDKEYLVPFSEFFPFANWNPMKRRIEGARTFERGRLDAPPLETRLGKVGILICNEAMLPEVASERVSAGAELLVSPSNDSWIAGRAFAEHMFSVVGLRAIEQRRYLVRASTAGPSAIVDPWGRIQSRTQPVSRGILIGQVRPARNQSAYNRLGDAFAVSCAALVLGVALAGPLRRGYVESSEG